MLSTRVANAADWRVEIQERAAILEHDAGLTRQEAEAAAISEYVDSCCANGRSIDGLLAELISASHIRSDPRLEPLLGAMGLLSRRAPAWGFGWVVPEGGTYRLADAGEVGHSALIVPCFEDGGLIDLVAEGPASGRMLPRIGNAAVVGRDSIERACELNEPLLVFHRASAWLRGHTLGTVVLDWEAAGEELQGVRRIACHQSIADRLYAATRRCWPRPTIAVAAGVHHAAA